MIYTVVDTETDGLLDDVTEILCMCVHTTWEDRTTDTMEFTEYEDMIDFIEEVNKYGDRRLIIGQNFVMFDQVVYERFLGVKFTVPIMDTLPVSQVLYPGRDSHGLDSWGYDLGTIKPYIGTWNGSNLPAIVNRCKMDVQINLKLFIKQYEYLLLIYDGDHETILSYISYLRFKMECAAEHEAVRWRLNVKKCEENLQFLMNEIQPRLDTLQGAMPPNIKYKDVERPEKVLRKDGTVSVAGEKWFERLREQGLPEHHVGAIRVVESTEQGNPNSPQQLKAWLFSLGWKPDYYKYSILKDGSTSKIPQINNQEGTGVCDSVLRLAEKEPAIDALDKLTKIKHRMGLLKGFLENAKPGEGDTRWLQAKIVGLTNTLRFQHTEIVNLPTVVKTYGGIVREVLIPPDEDHILCGSDMAGIEEATKHHYMYFYDPDIVKKIRTKGFDPHLNLAIEAKLCTEEDLKFYKQYEKDRDLQAEAFNPSKENKERYSAIKDIRINKGKKANFGAVYGAGGPKISLTAGIPLNLAYTLHKAFWKINRAVKLVAKYTRVKIFFKDGTIKTYSDGSLDNMDRKQMTAFMETVEVMWLWNPISKFWYSLRFLKDRFSTLNQGSAVYCFDIQVRNVRKHGIRMCGQFHDEWVAPLLKTDKEKVKQIAEQAIIETNQMLKLNIELGISVEFGSNYAEVH